MSAQRGWDFGAIKAQYPILDEAQKHTTLKRQGAEWVGLCPLHDEKTPSFSVNPDKECFSCFGCGAKGDITDLISQIHGISISAAIESLTGGKVASITPEKRSERDRVRMEAEAEDRERYAIGTREANRRWINAEPFRAGLSYTERKGISSLFEEIPMIKAEGNNVLLPVYDREGEIQSVQVITPALKDNKFFAKDTRMPGGRLNIGVSMGRTIICEGFATGASLFMSQYEQICIAFTSSNMEAIAKEILDNGSFVVLAADKDKGDHFLEVGKRLGCAVVVADGPERNWDFNDEFLLNGPDAVRAQVTDAITKFAQGKTKAQAAEKTAEGPLDLWMKSKPPAFNEDILPPIIGRFARIRADMMGCDASGLAMSAIAACGTVIRDSIQLRMKRHDPGWKEQARLWIMLVGDPSRKKTPILRASTKRIADIDANLIYEHERAMQDWAESKSGEMPKSQRLRISDITMEAAAEVCAHSPDGVLALQDELSGWFGGIEKYSGGKGGAKDRSFWLQAFNGGHYATDRIGRKAAFVDNLSISIVGGVQPDPIRKIMSDSTDDGLIQRFFPIMLGEPMPGKDIEMPDVASEYDALIDGLWALQPPESVVGPVPLTFSDEAQELRSQLELKHLEMMTAFEMINKKVASHIGKYDGIFGRLCIIFHCIEHVTNKPGKPLPHVVEYATAKRASRLLHDFLRGHAIAFYTNVAGLTDDHALIKDIAGFILSHNEQRVTLRTLARGSSAMRTLSKLTKFEANKVFEQMAAYGWLEEAEGRSDTCTWAVNPLVHTLYADRAESERIRRNAIREQIAQYVNEG